MNYQEMTATQLLVLPPHEAAAYLESQYPSGQADVAKLTKLIRLYRAGYSIRGLEKEVPMVFKNAKKWLLRAEKLHLVQVRRNAAAKALTLENQRLETERKKLEKDQRALQADERVAESIRQKVELILMHITPEKVEASRLKDLTDSLAKLITSGRLLLNQSTTNAQTQNIVHYIAHLNAIPLGEQMKLAQARVAQLSPPPPPPEKPPMAQALDELERPAPDEPDDDEDDEE